MLEFSLKMSFFRAGFKLKKLIQHALSALFLIFADEILVGCPSQATDV